MEKNNYEISKSAIIKDNVIIGENVIIEDNVYIDYGAIIKDNVHIKKGSFIGARCILGEYLYDFFENKNNNIHKLIIGEESIIRSGTIIYGDCVLGEKFQTGHNVVIREKTKIGQNVRIGTNSDIQNNVTIGSYVNIHSDVFISAENIINDYVWIFPRVLFTNDPNPPSKDVMGSIVESFASIGAGSIILPGTIIECDTLIGAGAIVKGVIKNGGVYVGNPCKRIKELTDIRSRVDDSEVYPWREHYKRGMPWEETEYNLWLNKCK